MWQEETQKIQEKFTVLENILNKKKQLLKENYYSGAENARLRDQETMTHLEAVYNILSVLSEKINRLEIQINNIP
jgi:phage portal protein BeeE